MEEEMDEFEAMEAEAEELARQVDESRRPNLNAQAQSRAPPRPIKPILRPGRPNPNVVPSGTKPKPQEAPVQKKAPVVQQQQEASVWVAFYQPEVIGIVNTQTGERLEGFKDEGSAQANAKVLNELNTIIISGGF